jgi:hypothetical protein
VLTDVSEERIASIFRIEDEISEQVQQAVVPAQAGSLADFFLSSTLKMEAVRSSETSVNTISTQCRTPEVGFLHSHRCENLISVSWLSNKD